MDHLETSYVSTFQDGPTSLQRKQRDPFIYCFSRSGHTFAINLLFDARVHNNHRYTRYTPLKWPFGYVNVLWIILQKKENVFLRSQVHHHKYNRSEEVKYAISILSRLVYRLH